MSESEKESRGPVKSDFFRVSQNKAIRIKLWPPRKSDIYPDSILPATVEIEEVTFNEDGSRQYGPSVRLTTRGSSFILAQKLIDYLKEGRELDKKLRQDMNQ